MATGASLLKFEKKDEELELRSIQDRSEEKIKIYTLDELFISHDDSFRLKDITVLNLQNSDIDKVPYTFQQLIKLKQLILRNNKLKEVPSLLYSGLASLELLDLSSNFIKNFDIEPACCPILKILNLNNNRMHSVPQWILTGQAQNLQELFFSHNEANNTNTKHKFKRLKIVEMCSARLRDDHFEFFAEQAELKSLDLSNNNTNNPMFENSFENIDFLFSAKWTALARLNLSNVMISIMPKKLFLIHSLVELNLSFCDLSWIPEEIKNLTQLEVIDVSRNSISFLPVELCLLPKLKILKASCNCISSLGSLSPQLRGLDLYENILESAPEAWESLEFCDFERNCFSTAGLGLYEKKLEKMRQLLIEAEEKNENSRMNGCRTPLALSEEEFESSESSDDEYYSLLNCSAVVEEENWDEEEEERGGEVEIDTNYARNPQITSSDDEWQGYEETPKSNKPPTGTATVIAPFPAHDFDELLFSDV